MTKTLMNFKFQFCKQLQCPLLVAQRGILGCCCSPVPSTYSFLPYVSCLLLLIYFFASSFAIGLAADYHSPVDPRDRIIAGYTALISLKPDNADAFLARGNAYMEKGELNEALADFSKAIAINPQYVAAYAGRGEVYFRQKLYDKAIADCDKAIELAPEEPKAYFTASHAYCVKRQYDDAIATYNALIANSTDPEVIALANRAIQALHPGGCFYAPRPTYSPTARLARKEGTVLVRLDIDADGVVTAAELIMSSGYADLDAATLQGLRQWRYVPVSKDGLPVAFSRLVKVRYSLTYP